jgi:hypothetical protein
MISSSGGKIYLAVMNMNMYLQKAERPPLEDTYDP